jgi:Xaa-Pro aminopeptidase
VTDVRNADACAYPDLERVRGSVADSGFAAVVAMSPANVAYLSGYRDPELGMASERLQALIWPAGGEPILVVPRTRAPDRSGQGEQDSTDPEQARPLVGDIRACDGDQLAVARAVAEAVSELGVRDAVLGVELGNLPFTVGSELARLLPGLRLEDATALLDGLRAIKSPVEVELITEVNRATAECLEFVLASVRPGDTEHQIAGRIAGALWERGAHGFGHATLAAGGRSRSWHPLPSGRRVDEGMLIRTDWGARIDAYASDIARNGVVGMATAVQRDRFARISEIHDTVVDAIRPGTLGSDLSELARREYTRLGLDYNWGSIGHSVGVLGDEPPVLLPGVDEPVLAGMMLGIDLGYVGEDGVHQIKDLVHVTADGAVNITQRLPGRSLIEALY